MYPGERGCGADRRRMPLLPIHRRSKMGPSPEGPRGPGGRLGVHRAVTERPECAAVGVDKERLGAHG